MSLSDPYFLLAFLPAALILLYISRDRVRDFILLIVNLLFYAFSDMDHLVLFVILTAFNVCLGSIISHRKLKTLVFFGAGVNILVLTFYKYSAFFERGLVRFTGRTFFTSPLLLPLGISFFTFKSISYLVDCQKGEATSPREALLYLTFFGQIQSGPISRFSDIKSCDINKDLFFAGMYRFASGFCKKILIANLLYAPVEEIFTASSLTPAYAWLGSVISSLQLFFDFSGYSDMAIGLSLMCGYDCPENFKYPYASASVSEFWKRWHITLGAWFRDYVYIPMGGSRVGKRRLILNLFTVWLLTGIWHGSGLNFIVWGLAYFVIIAFEKLFGFPSRIRSDPGKILYRIFVLVFVNFQWVIFRAADLRSGLYFIRSMFCYQGDRLQDLRAAVLLREYSIPLIAAIILSFPLGRIIFTNKDSRAVNVLSAILIVILFLISFSFAVSGSNNPFVYANF